MCRKWLINVEDVGFWEFYCIGKFCCLVMLFVFGWIWVYFWFVVGCGKIRRGKCDFEIKYLDFRRFNNCKFSLGIFGCYLLV